VSPLFNSTHPLFTVAVEGLHTGRYDNMMKSDTSLLSQCAQQVDLTVFLAMELLYFILATICFAIHRLVVPRLAYDLQFEWSLKGGFTILFILWQTLAIFPVSHIINYTFCRM
jgi:hypothetical protein